MSKKQAWIQLIFILSLTLVVAASAEGLYDHNSGLGLGGRSFVDPNSNFNNLSSIASSCAVGRPGVGGIAGAAIGANPAAQSAIGFGNGGIIQASVPEGFSGGTGNSIQQPPPTGGASSGQLLASNKCASCHATNGIAIDPVKALNKIGDGSMPKPPAPPLTPEEKIALTAHFSSLATR